MPKSEIVIKVKMSSNAVESPVEIVSGSGELFVSVVGFICSAEPRVEDEASEETGSGAISTTAAPTGEKGPAVLDCGKG